MTVAFSTAVRNARANAVTTAVGGSAILTLYNGTRPATGGTATTALCALTCNATFAPAASGGVLTLNSIANGTAGATGTATWARLTTSGGTFIADFDVNTSGSDVNLASTSITSGETVSVTSATITEGNP
jgi:hypothetical protein